MCSSIHKHNHNVAELRTPTARLGKEELDSLGCLISSIPLQSLSLIGFFDEGVYWKTLETLYTVLCTTTSLKSLFLSFDQFTYEDSKEFKDILMQNNKLQIHDI